MDNSGIINAVRTSNDPASTMNANTSGVNAGQPAAATLPGSATPTAVAPTVAPTPSVTPGAQAPATSMNDINSAYQSLFGRPADAAGASFWQNAATTNGWTPEQTRAQMASGARSDDVSAGNSLNGGGSIQQNWTQPGLSTDQVGNTVHWDATRNQWVAPPPQAPGVTAPAVATYNPSLLGDPTKWNVTPNQTVAGQITSILDPNSPIIQQARTQGLELANDRGLLNSSIGETAAMNSAYSAALPIASADASTYSKAAGYNADQSNQFAVKNQDATNTAGQFNSSQTNQMSQAVLSAQTQTAIANLQSQTQTNLANLDNQTKTNLAGLSNANQLALATINGQNQSLLQSNQSASSLFSQITQNIATISASTTMDATAKQQAVDNQLQMLKNGLSINGAISNLNLSSLLDFSGSSTSGAMPVQDNTQGNSKYPPTDSAWVNP